MRAVMSTGVFSLTLSIASFAASTRAQPEPAQPAPAQPAQPAPDSAAQQPAPGAQVPAGEQAPEEEAATQPQPAPPTYPEAAPPEEEPQPPRYEPLGTPEPEIEEGDWDPWEHATPKKHRHDGFFLRLSIGIGGGKVAGDGHILPDIGDVTLSSGGFGTSIGIGGALTDNFILNADLFQARLFDPDVEIDDRDAGDADDLDFELGVGEDVELGGLGVGVTYYIMPVNIYLAGSVGIGQIVFEDGRGDREGSDVGLAINAMVGKEWWVGVDWGIGVAGQFIMVRAEDDILGDVNGYALNVMFSATYN